MEAGVELFWLFLSRVVEIQAEVGVQPQTKVVVHHKDLHWWKLEWQFYKDLHQHQHQHSCSRISGCINTNISIINLRKFNSASVTEYQNQHHR